MIASSLAAIVASYLWGALSDRSSRQTLIIASIGAAITYFASAVVGFADMGTGLSYIVPGLIFAAQIAYQGARAGRKTHLTDMDADGRTSVYTALSNSVIGMMLLAGGLLGLLSEFIGASGVLALLGLLSTFAVFTARQLSEVQSDDAAG